MAGDPYYDDLIAELRAQLAAERRKSNAFERRYDQVLLGYGKLYQMLAALSSSVVGVGSNMRIAPGKRDEYCAAVRDLVAYWRKPEE